MDIFTKKRVTFWIIFLLVVLNISTISMLWLNQIKRPVHPAPTRQLKKDQRTLEFLQRELDLSDEQIHQYNQLKQSHAEQMHIFINDIRRLKKEMMEEVFKEKPDTTKAMEIADLIGAKQTEIEQITFKHFLDLKEMCGKEQVGKLRRLVDEFFRRNPPPGQKEPPPPPQQDRPMNPPSRQSRDRN